MIHYLLDTNIISEPINSKPNPKIISKLKQYQDEIAISSISWHELWFGCQRLPQSKKRKNIFKYLQTVVANLTILPYDETSAFWHAQERARLSKIGRPPPFADGQIASITITNNLTLVTKNTKDFQLFESLHMLNWSD